jgi:HEAT repeat protein
MSASTKIDQQLRQLEAIGASLPDDEAVAQVRRYLGNRSSVVVARAAALLAGVADDDLEVDLVAAFHRFMKDPARTDKGCIAKLALIEALRASHDPDAEIFLVGMRHVQLEPTWGGQVDTAAPLRARCALGLVEAGAADVLDELAILLADPEPDARLGAARALAACGPLSTPLLRFKALAGDDQPLVTAECLSGLMSVAPEASFDFVAGLLDPTRPEMAGPAAMALAESHTPAAFEVLRRAWEDTFLPEFRRELLLPIGLTRHEDAPVLLLSVLGAGDLATGTAAIAALAIYKGDPGLPERARSAIRGPHRERLLSALDRAFG